MTKSLPTLILSVAIAALGFLATPTTVAAQDCEGCNNLTDKCGPDEPNIQEWCYEDEDPEGEPYCHAYGGIGTCPPSFAMNADGVPAFDPSVMDVSEVAAVAEGVVAMVDCRGRLRAIAITAEAGEALRKTTAKIEI